MELSDNEASEMNPEDYAGLMSLIGLHVEIAGKRGIECTSEQLRTLALERISVLQGTTGLSMRQIISRTAVFLLQEVALMPVTKPCDPAVVAATEKTGLYKVPHGLKVEKNNRKSLFGDADGFIENGVRAMEDASERF